MPPRKPQTFNEIAAEVEQITQMNALGRIVPSSNALLREDAQIFVSSSSSEEDSI